MEKEKLLDVLRLQKTSSVGDVLAKKLIAATGDVSQIFREKPSNLLKISGIGRHLVNEIFSKNTQKLAALELDYILANHITTLYFLDENYPKNLIHCLDGPILLFQDGKIDLQNDRIISIVGTRKMTSYGSGVCKELLSGLKRYNPIVVSGFAYGVDICAHKEAFTNSLQTIAVLAHGMESVYPKIHKKYVHRLNENGGFLTEFWHDESPLRKNFLKRNRIVAGISKATIVVESAEKGGALVTADIANSYDREVFAFTGRATDVFSKGCNQLIQKNKAALVTSAEDIAQLLNWDLEVSKRQQPVIQSSLFVELSDNEQKIYNCLIKQGKQSSDAIALTCNIPIHTLATLLLQLEMKGVVKPLPGKLFEIV